MEAEGLELRTGETETVFHENAKGPLLVGLASQHATSAARAAGLESREPIRRSPPAPWGAVPALCSSTAGLRLRKTGCFPQRSVGAVETEFAFDWRGGNRARVAELPSEPTFGEQRLQLVGSQPRGFSVGAS